MRAIDDPRTDEEWLADMFEFEYCELCGLDVEDHFVWRDFMGLRHTGCKQEAA